MSDGSTAQTLSLFAELGLPENLTAPLVALGYEAPTPIQAATIPPLLAKRDLIGQAQTGTGKTAAFALPLLAAIDPKGPAAQALVLAPTRELALQVCEAITQYAAGLPNVRVLPVYGGTGYGDQLRGLSRGAQVVVGTPGRVIDHLERGSLDLSNLKFLVLDEADEMLRMGFIDDVETVLKAAPPKRQIALFSATMPPQIRRLAQTWLNSPEQITLAGKTSTAPTIRARAWIAGGGMDKFDGLCRLLEGEPYEAMLIFVRTRLGAADLVASLNDRGFDSAALHGDMQQKDRERVVEALREGKVKIVVATDVAARGLDVERLSHVVNFDLPGDVEGYVHRIGRTGRAGRSGEAILFATYRERPLLNLLEKGTRSLIEKLVLPGAELINTARTAKLEGQLIETLGERPKNHAVFRELLESFTTTRGLDPLDVAAALACRLQGGSPFHLRADPPPSPVEAAPKPRARTRDQDENQIEFGGGGKQLWRIEVGFRHGVEARNIVGALANEVGISSRNLGRIEIRDLYSLVELPANLPPTVIETLGNTWIAKRQLRAMPWPPAK
ncbi:MAG: DEAD/DEAH box helicase [Myxococcales bacterium]|nr:DEAD/DEAH box helicase [Myxococcales bacterium]